MYPSKELTMALDDRQHVEAVAIMHDLLERPAGVPIPADVRRGMEGWLHENHPPPSAYSNAMHSLAGVEPRPMPVSGMAALRDPDSVGVVVTLTTGVGEHERSWPFRFASTDSDALGCALRALREALVILGAES